MEYVFVQLNILELFVDLVNFQRKIKPFLNVDFICLDNPCYNPICRNGGFCSVNSNATSVSFTCTCQSLYTGQYCETPLNLQIDGNCSSECMNNGSCINGMCMCTSEYIGPSCQYGNIEKRKITMKYFLFLNRKSMSSTKSMFK